MPGFDNSTMYADNVDFTGNPMVSPKVLNDGELLVGSSTSPNIRVGTLTGGTGINVVNSAGGITLNAVPLPLPWTVVNVGGALTANTGTVYASSLVGNFSLPVTAAVGDTFELYQYGTGGITISHNAGQAIRFGTAFTTTGVTGQMASTNLADSVRIVCVEANTLYAVVSAVGNWLLT